MMLSIFSEHTLINYSFLKDFFIAEVAKEYPPEHKIACIKYFLVFFEHAQTPQEDKVQALQLILLPMLVSSFAKKESGRQPACFEPSLRRLRSREDSSLVPCPP